MRLLFSISVGCFCAMFWVAISVARRLKRQQAGRVVFSAPAFSQEFFEAGEFRTPRSLRLIQDVARWRPRQTALKDQVMAGEHLITVGRNSHSELARRLAASSFPGPEYGAPTQHSGSLFAAEERTRSFPARPVKMRRIDLSRFRENPGDFTDPYTEVSPMLEISRVAGNSLRENRSS
jgi:hypothetical protein